MSSGSSIVDLARRVLENAEKIQSYRDEAGLGPLSFEPDFTGREAGPLPTDMEHCRIETMSALLEMHDLIGGPRTSALPIVNSVAIEFIYRWDIILHVPERGDVSYGDLATEIGVREEIVRRMLRFAMVHHRLFRELRPGYVSHSAASWFVHQNSLVKDNVGVMFDEIVQACVRTCDAFERYSRSDEPGETGYSLAHGEGQTIWSHHASHPSRGARFARAMEALTLDPGNSLAHLTGGYPWSVLPEPSVIVDVGGGLGHASAAISEANPHLRFVVQDLPQTVEKARSENTLPEQVTMMGHDFFEEQPIKNADVYLLRWILHDWPDKYAIKILRALRPALKNGAKILICDSVMPKTGTTPLVIERQQRHADLVMTATFNAREREEEEWRQLIATADSRFQELSIWTPPGSILSFIEATWKEG